MDMPSEEELRALEASFDASESARFDSVEELVRSERASAARHFGFSQPTFRSLVRLRFTGKAVVGHDLNGDAAGAVIAHFTSVVGAAGGQRDLASNETELFLSPSVAAGSTILELYGSPIEPDERLDTEIDDAPIDRALDLLFEIFDDVNANPQHSEALSGIKSVLGQRLFRLSQDVLEYEIDLGLSWTRPRGSTKHTTLNRSTARTLEALLDAEEVEQVEREERGILAAISVDDVVGFRPEGRASITNITAPELDSERLRSLWGTAVVLYWTETITRHPGRQTQTSRRLRDIRRA